MPKKKMAEQSAETIGNETPAPEAMTVTGPAPEATDSPAKAEFRKFIEKYAKQNPEKYALKKEALERKLNSL